MSKSFPKNIFENADWEHILDFITYTNKTSSKVFIFMYFWGFMKEVLRRFIQFPQFMNLKRYNFQDLGQLIQNILLLLRFIVK